MPSIKDPIHAASRSVRITVEPAKKVELHVMIFSPPAGKGNGKTVVMLHGFPEFWGFWTPQVDALVEAGFQVVIPDQRGYNKSSMPPLTPDGINYGIPRLAADVIAVLDNLKLTKVLLVGHDFGGAVCWWTVMRYPERVERLVILTMPHPKAFFESWRDDPKQKSDSVYIQYFLTKQISPDIIRATHGGVLALSMRMSAKPNTFDEATLDAFRTAWLRKENGDAIVAAGSLASALALSKLQNDPGSLAANIAAATALSETAKLPWAGAAMVNWYNNLLKTWRDWKANPNDFDWPSPNGNVSVPVLVLEGQDDDFFQVNLLAKTMKLCKSPDSGGKLLLDATHWMAWDAPKRVNRLLVAYLKDHKILADNDVNMKDYTKL